ncbi:TerD family protein [Peribacillus asahii]|uniref:Chemical-damaging agent resistance protein C n=1 Tax=Peribacillus asahii TaxID=228899 RepID=A0A3T0KM34_9BACI|nr:TerD family protein [Peribacillus asahii]AZV41353.1 chemical-damaging agent resistance protein C [Peribacillus asahii]USK70849.1 TerD family protein [Peribacillus asahii]USK85762.1 TerD family protein [Peribacillus asahii]
MAIQLSKGQRIDLTKNDPTLQNIVIGLGWDVKQFDGGQAYDLDASAFLLNAAGKCRNEYDFIFYNNLQSSDGSVIHTGDNRTGEGDGDDEQLKIDLAKVPNDVEKVAIAVTIHEAEVRSQNFGQVSNAFVRLVNEDTNEEVLRFDLGEDFSIETAVVFCEIYRNKGEWKFSAVGAGYQGGLQALVNAYGLDA